MELLKNNVPEEKITIIPDATDFEIFPLNLDCTNIINKYSLKNKFVVGYSGLLGFAQDPINIVFAAKELRAYKDIVFLIVGDGGLREECEKLARDLNINNIIFTGEKSRDKIPYFIKTFSVGLITLANKNLFRNSMPSKLFDYFSSCIPVIINLRGIA
jgi:glycosyltransferase involved in cell wall biosynthesis